MVLGRVLFVTFIASTTLGAQPKGAVPKRPRSDAVRDTNDARAYYDLGVRIFDAAPETAADAFYWAARLDPTLAEPLYARRLAVIASRHHTLKEHFQSPRRRKGSREAQILDSLYFRALKINPFFYRSLDRQLFTKYILDAVEQDARILGKQVDRGAMSYEINVWMSRSGPEVRAWMAYSDGSYDEALKSFAIANQREKYKAPIRIERARIFAMRAQADSALAEYRLAIEEMRKKDEKELVVFYDSKASVEHGIGLLLEQTNDFAGAREAYGRSLQEDLAYYPAHMRLGLMQLAAGDTVAALSELELAVQTADHEPIVRLIYGSTLAAAGKIDEAVVQYKKAIELEPYWAQPYYMLGETLERQNATQAAEAFQQFLARASMNHILRQRATERLATLR